METEHKIMSIRIIASAVLLGSSYIPSFTVEIHIALCIAAYLLIGADIVYKAVRNLRYGRIFDENFLMTIATVGAFIIGEYPEAVAVMMFYQIGELFSDIAVARSKASISALIDIRPDYANIETDGILCKVSPEDVPAGSIIVIKPGEKVPLDGTILSGNSTLDTAALTGESLPREVSKGDAIISGSMNLTGLLRIRTSGTYGESTVAKILDLVQNADTGKAQSEKFITRFARYYTPIVVAVAALLALVPPMIIGGEWILWLNRALIFLVISCPCALVVSIPLTFFAGIGGASRKGILVKGSNYLEMLARIRMVALDKTGTLTRGDFSVTAVHPEMLSEQELIELAALAESYSDHPVSASLRNACAKPLDKARVSNVENIAGEGISATVDNRMVYAGNEKLMQRAGVTSKPCEKSGTIVHIAVDGVYMGHIVVSDSIKPQSADAIARMKAGGVKKTVMLTGDHRCVAAEVAQIVNIDEFHAELLPTDKVKIVEELRKEHPEYTIAFIGDGINDAPVLKLADVGIAMGLAGSDAAMEASDVILMNDNLMAVADGMSVARNTLKIVMQNIFFAIGVKFIMLLLGALGVANMWEAVFADVGVTVLAILNAMRAMHVKTK
ncbi:MAG: heavy metal translocating P-type ATPase [Prevotella sp.]|jgi:Cd2+/Zn2+-exporting ATPase